MTLAREDINSKENLEIYKRNELLEKLAKEKNVAFVDVNSKLKEGMKNKTKKEWMHLTFDDLHLNELGNIIVGKEIMDVY